MSRKRIIEEKKCPKCDTVFVGHTQFCSRKCVNSRVIGDEERAKISAGVKLYNKNNPITPKPKNIVTKTKLCGECNKSFSYVGFTPKYCPPCRKTKIGGYRPGSGRSNSGYYKGYYCGSTYELVWTIYNLDHNIPFKRFARKITDDWNVYYPDFELPDGTIVEIKGYEDTNSVLDKCEVAIKLGYKIKVLYKQDIEYMFEYVQKTYKTKEYQTLYAEYKKPPKIKTKTKCVSCGKEVQFDRKLSLNEIYKCRKCSYVSNEKIILTEEQINTIKKLRTDGTIIKSIAKIVGVSKNIIYSALKNK